jgi:hypothetical protein
MPATCKVVALWLCCYVTIVLFYAADCREHIFMLHRNEQATTNTIHSSRHILREQTTIIFFYVVLQEKQQQLYS